MKKLSTLLSILLAMLAVTSCTQAPTTPVDTTPDTLPQEQTMGDVTQQEIITEAETEREIPDGSFVTDRYTVHGVDGLYYLNFNEGNEVETTTQDDLNAFISVQSISFATLGEMREKLMTGQLTEDEIQCAKRRFVMDERGIPVPNLNDLYQPIVPEGFKMSKILWLGNAYSTSVLKGNTAISAGYSFVAYDAWKMEYDSVMETIQAKEVESYEQGTFEGFPCETYVIITGTAKLKWVIVTFPCEDKNETKYAIIEYTLDYFGPLTDSSVTQPSDVYPAKVGIYGQKGGQNYKAIIMFPKVEATADFLNSFGITPYVEQPLSLVKGAPL